MKKIIFTVIIVLTLNNIVYGERYADKALREDTVCPQILQLILKALQEESELKASAKTLESLSLVYSNLCLEEKNKKDINVELDLKNKSISTPHGNYWIHR